MRWKQQFLNKNKLRITIFNLSTKNQTHFRNHTRSLFVHFVLCFVVLCQRANFCWFFPIKLRTLLDEISLVKYYFSIELNSTKILQLCEMFRVNSINLAPTQKTKVNTIWTFHCNDDAIFYFVIIIITTTTATTTAATETITAAATTQQREKHKKIVEKSLFVYNESAHHTIDICYADMEGKCKQRGRRFDVLYALFST